MTTLPEHTPVPEEPDHREFLFMGIGWMLMDLRQDIDFSDTFDVPMSVQEIKDRLWDLQGMCADYANEHFPYVERKVDPPNAGGF